MEYSIGGITFIHLPQASSMRRNNFFYIDNRNCGPTYLHMKKKMLLLYARRGDEIPREKFHCSKVQDPEGGQWSVVTQVELILTRILTEEPPYIFFAGSVTPCY